MCGPGPRNPVGRFDPFTMQKSHSNKFQGRKSLAPHFTPLPPKRRVQLLKPKLDGIQDIPRLSLAEIPGGSAQYANDLRDPDVELLHMVGPQGGMDRHVNPFGMEDIFEMRLEETADDPDVRGMELEPYMEPQEVVECPPEMVEPVVPVDGAPGDGAAGPPTVWDNVDEGRDGWRLLDDLL